MFSFLFNTTSAIFAYLYPAYSSFKVLSRRPADENALERWAMYWAILASLLSVEQFFPLVPWLPFYAPIRLIFLLYLVLPQTQGSTFVYKLYLEPLLVAHEGEIDGLLDNAKQRLWTELSEWSNKLWAMLLGSLGGQSATAGQAPSTGSGYGAERQGPLATPLQPSATPGGAQPPTLSSPLAGTAQLLGSLWNTYGTAALATGAQIIQNQRARAEAASSTRNAAGYDVAEPATGSTSAVYSNIGALNSRRSGAPSTPSPSSVPSSLAPGGGPSFPTAQPFLHPPSPHTSTGSNNNGYMSSSSDDREVISHEDAAGAPSSSTGGWLGWMGSASARGSYERVKDKDE